jgi:hypothetical protein
MATTPNNLFMLPLPMAEIGANLNLSRIPVEIRRTIEYGSTVRLGA